MDELLDSDLQRPHLEPSNGLSTASSQVLPSSFEKKPEWLKVKIPGGEKFIEIKQKLRELKLFTVCEEARCPNVGECWSGGTATIMLLGEVCTRGCHFCAVKTGRPGGVVDLEEPNKVSTLIAESGLEYVVLTSVNRDDLVDGGAKHFAETIRLIKHKAPNVLCEALVPDFKGSLPSVETLVLSGLDVFAHNIETVRSQTSKVRDPRAKYDQSLMVLREAKAIYQEKFDRGILKNKMLTKTSIQLGHGEKDEEVLETLHDLRVNHVDVVTFGQYLQPSKKHLKVQQYVWPDKFEFWRKTAIDLGFVYVASGALVRSSYKAGEFYLKNILHQSQNNQSQN